jgi:hypothetical protein
VSEVSTSTPTRVVVSRPHANARVRRLTAVTGVLFTATLLGVSSKVGAQTTTTAAPVTSTTLPGASLALVMEPVTGNTGISLTAPNAMRTSVVITNETKVPLTNQQMVVRFGVKPDFINSVIDSSGPVGLIDATTGAWFHTIAAIQPGERVTYSVNWFKLCPGKWPMAVRVGDRQVSSTVQWSGTSNDSRCPADESTNPQPSSFYALSWPSSISPTTPTTATGVVVIPSTVASIPPSSIAIPATTVATAVTTTSVPPISTTTALRPSTTLVTSSTIQSLPGPTTPSATAPTTTRLAGPTTTRAGLPSISTTTISARSNGPTTTLFCKTIGGNKYCGPKSSAYKEGQEKAQELKPGQKPGQKTVAKAKPKSKAKTKKR